MKIFYRVRERTEEVLNNSWFDNHDTIIAQDVFIADSMDDFKESMRAMYGDNVAFKNSKSLKPGDLYITVISKDAHSAEDYLSVFDYKCAVCGREYKSNNRNLIKLHSWDLSTLQRICPTKYAEEASELENLTFCCNNCKTNFIIKKSDEYRAYNDDNDLVSEEFISEGSFSYDTGYIYMITKKSTGEFYVGQTKYCPIFRWGQHLKTERFKIQNITDYKFEVLEVLSSDKDKLNIREAYWINKKYDENPEKSLNIQKPKCNQES